MPRRNEVSYFTSTQVYFLLYRFFYIKDVVSVTFFNFFHFHVIFSDLVQVNLYAILVFVVNLRFKKLKMIILENMFILE